MRNRALVKALDEPLLQDEKEKSCNDAL